MLFKSIFVLSCALAVAQPQDFPPFPPPTSQEQQPPPSFTNPPSPAPAPAPPSLTDLLNQFQGSTQPSQTPPPSVGYLPLYQCILNPQRCIPGSLVGGGAAVSADSQGAGLGAGLGALGGLQGLQGLGALFAGLG